MNDPHPFGQHADKYEDTEAVSLRFSPEDSAHTAAEGRWEARKLVKIPSFKLRDEFLWRGGPLISRAPSWSP